MKTSGYFNIAIGLWSLLGLAMAGSAQTGPGMEGRIQPRRQVNVTWEGREIAVYHYGEALDKSYIHPLWTPDRHCVTYDAPADHLHHRALCVGWPDVSGTDFWAEINSPPGERGRVAVDTVETHSTHGGFQIIENNRWIKENGTELVQGKYIWTFFEPQGNLQAVDVELQLKALAPKVIFGSDAEAPREYHGLTIRIGPLADVRYFNSAGTEGGPNCKGQPARWCAASGTQHGAPVTVALMDHPSNDCHPTRFYVQDQGMQFISSSPNFARPRIVNRGEEWVLKYRVIAAGKPEEGKTWDLESLWRQWTGKTE